MRIAAGCAAAATGLGLALTVAADGVAATLGWGMLGNVLMALLLVGVGAPLARRPDGRRIGLLLFGCGAAMALSVLGGGYAAAGRTAGWPLVGAVDVLSSDVLWAFCVIPPTTVLFAVFPDGRALSPRWRPVVWLGWAASAAGALAETHAVAGVLTAVLWPLAGLAGFLSLAVRWRRAGGVVRQQLQYLLLAGLLVLLAYLAADALPYHLQQLALLSVPLVLIGAVGLAVVRYRLYDVDLVVRRTAVFTGVTVLVFLTYLAVAAAIGTTDAERAALTASVVVAAVAEPARRRIQRATTRLLYGRRDEPLAALAVLREQLRDVDDEAELGAAVVAVVPGLVRTASVAVELLSDGEAREVARAGPPDDDPVRFPLVHQSELLGTLLVGRREPGVAFTAADTSLLTELAHQVAAAAHAVRLRGDLRAATDRVVRAATEERERLRRDLHDRLGPLLVGTGLALDGVRRDVGDDRGVATALDELAGHLRSASGEVRRIVDRLRPPALLDRGLAGSVREHLGRLARLPGVPEFTFRSADGSALPAAVEEAAYFLVLEAVTNVVRHAEARSVSVSLVRTATALDVEVVDDGHGLGEPYVAGVGIGSMRRRAQEVGGTFSIGTAPGGGTRVLASFPVEEEPCPPLPSGSSSPTTTTSSGSGSGGCSTPSTGWTSSGRQLTPTGPSGPPSS